MADFRIDADFRNDLRLGVSALAWTPVRQVGGHRFPLDGSFQSAHHRGPPEPSGELAFPGAVLARVFAGVHLEELVVPRVHDHEIRIGMPDRVFHQLQDLARADGDRSQVEHLDGAIGVGLLQQDFQVPRKGHVG